MFVNQIDKSLTFSCSLNLAIYDHLPVAFRSRRSFQRTAAGLKDGQVGKWGDYPWESSTNWIKLSPAGMERKDLVLDFISLTESMLECSPHRMTGTGPEQTGTIAKTSEK